MAIKTITFPAASSTPIIRRDFLGEFTEILEVSAEAVDLKWFNSGNARMLMNHRMDEPVGNITGAEIDGDRVMITAQFDDSIPEAAAVIERLDAEVPLLDSVSIGWSAREKDVEVIPNADGSDDGDFTVTYKAWKPRETSFVSLPADETVGVTRSDDPGNQINERGMRARAILERANKARISSQKEKATMSKKPETQPETTPEARNDNPQPTPEAKPEARADNKPDGKEAFAIIRDQADDLKRLGVAESHIREMEGDAINDNWSAEKARAACLAAYKKADPDVETPSRGGQKAETRRRTMDHAKERPFSLVRAVQEAYAGRLKTGSGSQEAEMMLDAERNSVLGRTRGEDEFCLPIRLAAQDPLFGNPVAQRMARINPYFARAFEKGTSGNTGVGSPNGAIFLAELDDTQIIPALYNRPGIFNYVTIMPGMLDRDLRIPLQTGRMGTSWVGEDDTRADTTTSTFASSVVWTWKEIQGQFGITRQTIDQIPYIQAMLTQTLEEDIPRGINLAILHGAGGTAPTGITATTSVPKVTTTGANGDDFTHGMASTMIANLGKANAHKSGEAMFFMNEATSERVRLQQMFTSTSGSTTFNTGGALLSMRDSDGAMRIAGKMLVSDNDLKDDTTKGNNTALNTVLYGVPSMVKLGYFSEMSLIVDPYTGKKQGEVQIQIRQALDANLVRPEFFTFADEVVGA